MIGTLDTSRNMWRNKGRLNFPIDGLVLYAPLWHPELNTTPFISKDLNAHSCTVVGTTWGITGRDFDGADDYVDCGTAASLRPTTAITMMAWVNTDTITGGWDAYLAHENQVYELYQTSANIGSYLKTGDGTSDLDSTVNAVVGTWFCVAGTFDSTLASNQHKVFVDGALGDEVTITGTLDYGVYTHLRIGVIYATANDFDGTIGEVWIYNRALSSVEITHIYNVTRWRYQ